jgi:cyclohexa-1,5-dienecarbonyl-CoA hydratase
MSASVENLVVVTQLESGAVLDLRLNRPKANILDAAMMAALSTELTLAATDKDLKLVVIRGTGGHFSFGASVEEHRKERAPAMLAGFHALIRQIGRFPVPVAALIEGQCLGGAFELVLVCHLLFATPNAQLGCPEIRLGVLPPVLAAVGAQRLGGALAERMLLTGASLPATEAQAHGLLSVLEGDTPPLEQLLSWYGKNLEPLSAFALRQGTLAIRQGSGLLDALDRGLAEAEALYLREILASHDGNEGIDAFLARRPAKWENA